MSRKFNDNLRNALELADRLRVFAVEAAREANDDSCRGIYAR